MADGSGATSTEWSTRLEGVREGLARAVERLREDWPERLERAGLDEADFALLTEAGLHLTGLPAAEGGLWAGPRASVRPYVGLFRLLARADPSLALVTTMHPSVLSFWLLEGPGGAGEEGAGEGHGDLREQRRRLWAAVRRGEWFGTIASEPGSGGDLLATRAVARPDGGGGWRLTGDKHMGSGSGVTAWMVTTAVPEGESLPDLFLLATGGVPWDGSRGMKLVREWDGRGMAATQSHAFRFEGMAAERYARPGGALPLAPLAIPFTVALFTSVTVGILDAAIETGRETLAPRGGRLRSAEQMDWARAENGYWLACQALEGMVQAVAREAGAPPEDPPMGLTEAVAHGKLAVAELAEQTLVHLSRAVGGRAYSRSTPFGRWAEDVKALGHLRPPWGLAWEQIIAARREAAPPP